MDKNQGDKLLHMVQITEDPSVTPQVGEKLTFEPIRIKLLSTDTTVFMENLDAFDGIVLTFHFADEEEHNVDGSAVLVAPGVALAAKHVIEPYLKALEDGKRHSMCVGIAKGATNVWAVRKVTILPNSDVAILGLALSSQLPADRIFRQARLSTRLPASGERVQIVGFRAASASRAFESGEPGYVVEAKLIVSAGTVGERYPQPTGRDRIILPWPVLQVNCPSWGGMSGGPVFDSHGNLIGLLCSSFDVKEGDGFSYVSLLWCALATKFEGGWPASVFPLPRTLLEMAPVPCLIDRPDAIICTLDEASGETRIEYTPWE